MWYLLRGHWRRSARDARTLWTHVPLAMRKGVDRHQGGRRDVPLMQGCAHTQQQDWSDAEMDSVDGGSRAKKDIGPFVAVTEALERTKRRLMEERTTLVVPGMKRRLDTLTKATQNETNPIGRACLLTQLSAPDEPRSALVKRFVQIARSALTLEAKKERLRRSAEALAKRKYEYDLYELMKRLRRYR